MRVATRNYQGERGEAKITISLLPFFQQHGMNVTFKVVHRNQGLIQRKCQRFLRAIVPVVRQALTTGTIARRCSREANSGTTPPWGWCVAIWEATTFEMISSPERTTAAAVSSQELSMPRM